MYEDITKAIQKLHTEDGTFETNIQGVYTFNRHQVLEKGPQVYQPSLIFISSGKKNLYLNNKKYSYGDGKLILISTTTPILCEAIKENDKAFTGLIINLNRKDLYTLVKEINQGYKPKGKHQQLQPGILPVEMNTNLHQAFLHLLSCCQDKQDSEILGHSLIKEILYYTLKEEEAKTFCDLVLYNKSFSIFGDIIENIHKNFNKSISIERLAEEIDMSLSTFFRKFKAFTGYSPTQYIKDLRLNHAKLLLSSKKITVKEAAKQVGYTSQSQFSREYKRYFGYAPVLEHDK